MLTIHTRQKGVSLIEAMISLVVISVGLLGIAALQVTSMKQNDSALNHSQAVWIGNDISDRIRANFGAFADYDGIDTDLEYEQACTAVTPCDETKLVTMDAADWKVEMQNLPSGRGIITGSGVPIDRLVINVMWDDEGAGGTGTACGPDPAVDLTCYTVTLIR